MAYREIKDARGVTWEVWQVTPAMVERRETLHGAAPPGQERRTHHEVRATLSPEMRDGWLAFRSNSERRRIVPVPAGWEQLSEDELLQLLHGAAHTGTMRRLIE